VQTDSVTLHAANIGGVPFVSDVRPAIAPSGYMLSQNYPNPFNPSTQIRYSLGNAGIVTLKVYSILGVEVATLVNANQAAGNYTVTFNANSGQSGLSSGVYFYRLETGSFVSTRKLIFMK
jgi:hypothetical protein